MANTKLIGRALPILGKMIPIAVVREKHFVLIRFIGLRKVMSTNAT
jgi:hypothetical protein